MSRHTPLLVAAALYALCCAGSADEQRYRLDIRATSGVNHQPPVDARIKVTGPGVREIEYPWDFAVARTELQQYRGIRLGEGARIVVLLAPGDYHISITCPQHESFDQTITIPGEGVAPASAGPTAGQQLSVELAGKSDAGERNIVATVLESIQNDDGSQTTRPLPGARVYVLDTDTDTVASHGTGKRGSDAACVTGEDGVAVFHTTDLMMGERVIVAAAKTGYEPAQQGLTVSTTGHDWSLTSASAWDKVTLTLKRAKTGARLVVRVVDSETGQPVTGAAVTVKSFGGQPSPAMLTNAEGCTEPIPFSIGQAGEAHAYAQVQVSKQGYYAKQDDLPNEYLEPAVEAKTYPIQLEPIGTGPHWTEGEKAALARFIAWARGKNPNGVRQMFDQDASVDWQQPYRTPTGETITLQCHAKCTHQPQHARGEREPPDYSNLKNRPDLRKVSIAGNPGIGTAEARQGAFYEWQQGWMDVSLTVRSPWLGTPTAEEVLRMANELAGAIGNPGH